MKLIRIPYDSDYPFVSREVHELKVTNATLVLVPDEETLHEVQGLAMIANKKVIVRVLEPGKELAWESNMSSPWHVNTDKYKLAFSTTSNCQTPHLLFNCL